MVAAIAAAEHAPQGTEIILLEQNSKLGKKLLATGNGRCNLDNLYCTTERYFTSDPTRVTEMLQHIAQLHLPNWFLTHGLLCREAEDGRLYPYSNQAADVVNILVYWLERHQVQINTEFRISKIIAKEQGFLVHAEDGRSFYGDAVICAMGGNAGPQFGTEGFGIKTAFRTGCSMEPLYPCLVPLKCNKTQIQGLSGIRVKAVATLYDGTQPIHWENGEIQFTDYGLSGIAIMQLSGWLGPQHGIKTPSIELNLFPQSDTDTLAKSLTKRASLLPGASVQTYMTGLIHPQIGTAVWQAQQLCHHTSVDTLTELDWLKLAHGLQHWTFTELEPTGWKNAQTTGGGVALHQLHPHSFALKENPRMYFVGETVDCAGYCGGYNLHWAFGSGILAGIDAATH